MNIALVAHDSRKEEIVEWFKYNLNELKTHKLFATGTTGKLLRDAYQENLEDSECIYDIRPTSENWDRYNKEAEDLVTCLHSGPLGGDQEIGAMIAKGEIDVLIFFCDNLIQQGHQNDVSALTRLASLYNIAFATNRTTADMILTSPLFKDPNYKRILPSAIERYKERFNFKNEKK